jgi:putative peptide zinc metalloprotease protein
VLVVGSSDVVAPTNAAVAANGGCVACATAALAVQLVVSLNAMPDEQVQAQLSAALAELDGIEQLDGALDLDAVYAQVKAVEAEVLGILTTAGLVDGTEQAEAGTAAATAAEPAATPRPSSGTGAVSPRPSSAPTPGASPSPVPSARPSPSRAPSPSPSPSDAAPSATPSP